MSVWKKVPSGIALIVSLLLLSYSAGPLEGQGVEPARALPDGPERELVASACSRCHAIDVVTSRKKTPGEWETSVNDMISRGAQISGDEAKSIARYLGAHFSPDSRPPSGAADPGAAFPDAPGKEVLMSKCFQCHNEGMWKTLRQDKKGWEAAIYPMIGRGALWTEEEIDRMAQYLATAFGPKTVETPQSQENRK